LVVLCGLFGKSRQAYYQYQKGSFGREIKESLLCDAVIDIRGIAPRLGAYKLYLMLCCLFGREALKGRDSFYRLLRRKGLMLAPCKGRRTTNSNHRFHKYKNLIKGMVLTGANQLWVSDITYIPLSGGVCYLHLITDAYSHKIIGWVLAPGLHVEYTLQALDMAILQTGKSDLSGLIHHSDRGIQYCSNPYVEHLNRYKITISMTEDSKPTDNAVAERVNGIIKQEWLYQIPPVDDIEHLREDLIRIINFYNQERPHMSNGMLTPCQAHQQCGELNKTWKKKHYIKKQSQYEK
jgi:transposase InsO family protein